MKVEDVDLGLYVEGMSLLIRSGVFRALEEMGRAKPVVGFESYSERSIAEMNRSIGFNQALDLLFMFREKFLQSEETYTPLRDYGAFQKIVKDLNLNEKEQNVIGRYFGRATYAEQSTKQ